LYHFLLLFNSHVDDLRYMSQCIDETNKGAGVNVRFSVRKAFNQLDVTVESAHGVVDSLLQFIAGAVSRLSDNDGF
jgi:hypothetical protein